MTITDRMAAWRRERRVLARFALGRLETGAGARVVALMLRTQLADQDRACVGRRP